MKHLRIYVVLLVATWYAPGAHAAPPAGSVYLEGRSSDRGLILCHGRGKSPTWKVVDPLRKGVNERLGYHTLSLQLPNTKSSFREYVEDFPEAYKRIQEGILYLRDEQHVKYLYLMGHSMGARMASGFLKENTAAPVNGLIVAGCRKGGGTTSLNCSNNLFSVSIPVLDIWGAADRKDNDAAFARREYLSTVYRQIEIHNANHRFDGHEDEFVNAVINWLQGNAGT